MIRSRISRPFGRLVVPLTERDAVRSLGALIGEALDKRYEAGWAIRSRTCDGRIGLNMIDGSGCGGGLGTNLCGADAEQTGTSGAGDVWWAQRSEGRTVRLQYDLGPSATFSGSAVSSRGIASNRALPVSGSPTITTFSYSDGVLTWDTSGGNVFLDSTGALSLSGYSLGSATGTMQAVAGTTYTLTVRNQNGVLVTGTAIVPSQADGLVIVDSVGNVYAMTEAGGVWTAAWCGTAPFFQAVAPTYSATGTYIEPIPEEPALTGYRGYWAGETLEYIPTGDCYNIIPTCDWGTVAATGLPADCADEATDSDGWSICRGDVSIHTGMCGLVYHEFSNNAYDGTGLNRGVLVLGATENTNWRLYDPNWLKYSIGTRMCVVVWGSDDPYVGLADVLTSGGTTAALRLLEAGVDNNWAEEQSVTIPDIGSWGVARVEPTWWIGAVIQGSRLYYQY